MTRKLKFREKLDEFSTNQSSRRKTEISVKMWMSFPGFANKG